MAYLVSSQAPAGTLDNLYNLVNGLIDSVSPFRVTLSDDQKRGVRTMAYGREGYARMVAQIALSHTAALPREHNPEDLNKRLEYDARLERCRQVLMTLQEVINETQLANGMDIMRLVDDYVAVLQVSRNNSGPLDIAMREVDVWNNRFGKRTEEGNGNGTPTAAS